MMHSVHGSCCAFSTSSLPGLVRVRSRKQRLLCKGTAEIQQSSCTRRSVNLAAGTSLLSLLYQQPCLATGRSTLRKKVPVDQYLVSGDSGLKYYDVQEGKGMAVSRGTEVVVHWDVLYRGIDVVSSRLARTLGGNRTIAEPFDFVAGESVIVQVKMSDTGNALFAGGGGPKPPPALSTAVIGMKPGGIRSIIVDNPDLGYKGKRMQEIPPGDTFELRVELLEVVTPKPSKSPNA